MARLLIRNVPEQVVETLDLLAKLAGMSREAWLRERLSGMAAASSVQPDRGQPRVVGWNEIRLADDTPCAMTGEVLSAGSTALVELWSDHRPGRVLSERGLALELDEV